MMVGGSMAVVLPSHAQEGDRKKVRQEIDDIVKKIQARYERTADLQADFTQKTRIEGFATPVVSSGKLYVKKPGRLRWDYLEPAVEHIYVDKDDVKMYVPEHQQVVVGKLSQMVASQAPLQLLQGAAKLEEEFHIEPGPEDGRGAGGIRLLTLLPKQGPPDSSRPFQRIIVEVQPKTYFLKTVSLHEISGNVATFEFTGFKPNSGLTDDVFEFEVPNGVEVVKAPVVGRP